MQHWEIHDPSVIGPTKHAVGYFSHLNDAEAAIHDLRTVGFPLSQISLVHRDLTRREPFAGVNLTDRIDTKRFRLPDARTHFYNERINRGDYLVIVDGTEDEIRRAEAILKRRGIQEFGIFDATDTHGVHHQGYDRDIRHETPGVNTTLNERPVVNNSPTSYDKDDPAVIIVDHRNETV
ncbi:MAG: hypothetical protein HC773_23840 [Scytonema sp. CRU_2_7]|nr:hypothetical protein [Scytonema sp. CRU_2_7]